MSYKNDQGFSIIDILLSILIMSFVIIGGLRVGGVFLDDAKASSLAQETAILFNKMLLLRDNQLVQYTARKGGDWFKFAGVSKISGTGVNSVVNLPSGAKAYYYSLMIGGKRTGGLVVYNIDTDYCVSFVNYLTRELSNIADRINLSGYTLYDVRTGATLSIARKTTACKNASIRNTFYVAIYDYL